MAGYATIAALLVILALVSGLGSCAQSELSRASSSFGVKLYQQVARASRADNVIISPFSVYTALSMTLLGARGSSQDELRTVLELSSHQDVHSALHTVLTSLPRSDNSKVTLRLADALYYDNHQMTLSQSFSQAFHSYYGGDPRTFQRPHPETPINNWVSQNTGGKIRDFLSSGDIEDNTVLMLLNAVYFQGKWKYVFNGTKHSFVHPHQFTTAAGVTKDVDMMACEGPFAMKFIGQGTARARVLELPYGDDNRFSMFVLLPNSHGSLDDLESQLNSQMLEEAVTNMPHPQGIIVFMPKFSLRLKTSMKDMLKAMGLTRLFSNADLSGMVAQSSWPTLAVTEVKHEARIEVDEQGTTASAVTAVSFGGSFVIGMGLIVFVIDSPFLVVLRDKQAGLNLFMGRVNDPTHN